MAIVNNKSQPVLLMVSLFILMAPLHMADANDPKVPFQFAVGKSKFQENCASCHGLWAEGTEQGPPLIHGFYKPSHHGDRAFYSAALNGVRAHHWEFGDMPPVPGITAQDMDAIVPFLRWLQQYRGLY